MLSNQHRSLVLNTMNNKAKKNYTFIDLFAGCGGLSLGFEMAGFTSVLAIDNWKDALTTYAYNRKGARTLCADLATLDPFKIKAEYGISEMDAYHFLSKNQYCRCFDWSEGFDNILDIISFVEKRVLNLRGETLSIPQHKLLKEYSKSPLFREKGGWMQFVLSETSSILKYYKLKLVNFDFSDDVYRIIISTESNSLHLCELSLADYCFKFHFPMSVKSSERKVLGDVIVKDSDQDESLFFSEKAVAGMMAVREKMNKGRAMSLSEPCNTVSAHLAKVSLNSTDPVYMVGERYRRFSSREVARIQSFPDSFYFDSVSQIRQYKAIGNAVPPVMMWHVIHSLQKVMSIQQVDFSELKEQYPTGIVKNKPNISHLEIDKSKNLLIGLVKADNIDQYLDRSAKVYYTGKRFPSTVALNKLYYFMPYVKNKGIRDLYFIKIARIGTRKEGQPDEDKNDFRLVFEIEFVEQMFDDYKPIKLEIWKTFTDTTIDGLRKYIYIKTNQKYNRKL